MIDDKTPLGWPLPHPGNDPFAVDVPRLREALTLIDAAIAAARVDLGARPTGTAVDAKIKAAVDALKGGAPEALDTLIEIASKLASNDDVVAALISQIGMKASQSSVDTVTAALAERLGTIEAAALLKAGGTLTGLLVFAAEQFATSAQINAGTGKGIANAQTLGPILQGIKDTTAAATSTVPEIGSYLLRPANLPAPGPNWFEAKGQIVSLASYPGLAAALPATIKQLGAQNPAGQGLFAVEVSGGAGGQSQIHHALFEGTRFASLQSQYVRFQDPANGKNFEREMSPNSFSYGTVYTIPPVIRDNNEIVYIISGASQVAHIDLNTQAGLDAGVKSSNTNVEASGSHNYEGLYKLPNGTLIFVSANRNGATGDYQRIWKLPPQSAFNTWQSFEPIAGTQANVMPSYFPHFQTKSGHVYALLSASAGSKAGPVYTVYRTLDGSSWQNLGTVTFDRTTQAWVAGGKRREVNARMFSVMEESPDGQDIIVTLGYVGFLVSSNGGASWTVRTANSLLGLTALGFNDPTNETYRVGYKWDAIGNQWVFSYFGPKTGGGAQQYVLTLTGSRLTNLAKYQEIKLTSLTTGTDGNQCFIFRTQGFLHIIFGISGGGQYRIKVPVQSTGNIEVSPTANNLNSRVGLYLTGLLFDGIVLMPSDSSAAYTIWIFNDDSEQIQAYDGNYQMRGFTFSASPDGLNVCIQGTYSAASQAYIYKNTAFDYNPATERKLPNTYFQSPGGSPAVREEYRQSASQPKFFMRVK